MKEEDYNLPSDEFVRSIDIHTLLPQQEPFVLVGRLEHFDKIRVATSTEISSDNIFVSSGNSPEECGKMSAAGLIENIAQTCAARIGYINKYILKKGIQIGFIGAIRNMKISALPKVGERILTEVEVREEVFGMLLASAVVKAGDRVLATTEMKIAVKES